MKLFIEEWFQSGLVHPLVNRRVAGIVGHFFVVFPDVSGDRFYAVLTFRTQMPCGTVSTYLWITLKWLS